MTSSASSAPALAATSPRRSRRPIWPRRCGAWQPGTPPSPRARGYTYRECASELFISIKTVETHVSAVLRKLQLSNRNELTRWAAARHLL